MNISIKTNVKRILGLTIIAVAAVTLAFLMTMPVMAAPKCGTGNQPPCPTATPGGGDLTLTVSCIEWALTGGQGQHLHVQAFVMDQDGNPVLDAVVSMSARRDGVEYAVVGGPTGSYAGLDGGEGCPGGPPGTGVTSDFCVNWADSGHYDVEVLSVIKAGYTWDSVQPVDNDYDHVRP